jgi:hypothetical protein
VGRFGSMMGVDVCEGWLIDAISSQASREYLLSIYTFEVSFYHTYGCSGFPIPPVLPQPQAALISSHSPRSLPTEPQS